MPRRCGKHPGAGRLVGVDVANRTCSIDGCGRPHYGHDWCNMHYQRWRKWGDPLETTVIRGDSLERLIRKFTTAELGCWPWESAESDGYSLVRWAGKNQLAHRVLYELLVGPIPAGAQLDHTCHSDDETCDGGPCRHRRCVNPGHLEPVTQTENMQRVLRNRPESKRTHCPCGHALSGPNLYVDPRGYRGCRACRQAASDRHRARSAAL